MSETCHLTGCPCREFALKTLSEPSTTGKEDVGFLVPEAENALSGDSAQSSRIPAAQTAFDCHLDICTVCGLVAKQFPDLGLFDHQLCPEGRQLFRNPSQSVVTVPDFLSEWNSAPRWTTRLTEQQVAEWWFIRGQHAREVELLAGMNCDLREMVRVTKERMGR